MLFINQEERRASDMVLSTSENNDITNQSEDTSFFTSEKNRMTNQLASPARRDYFYLDAFWHVDLVMYNIKADKPCRLSLEEFVSHSPAARGYKFFSCSTNIPSGLSAYNP